MPRETSTGLRNLDSGDMKSVYLTLKEGAVDYLDQLARENRVSRSELMRYAIRHFLNEFQQGKVTLQTEKRQTSVGLRMP